MEWSEEVEQVDSINGDRRQRVLDTGVGQTVDLSSGGVLFDPGRHLPVGLNVELAIAWPVLLRNEAPMQLVVAGRIVRTAEGQTAVAMSQHEFRTARAMVDQHPTKGVAASPAS